MNSHGGQLMHGYALGQIFKNYGVYANVVGNQQCASACAIAFLGAKSRNIQHDGKLIFHSPYISNFGGRPSCPTKQQMPELRQYIVDTLGLKNGEFVFDRTMSFCSPYDGWTVNGDAAKLFGITTK